MDQLKLVALDDDGLQVVSAHVQDAVMKVADLDYRKAASTFLLPMYRFAWEAGSDTPERRNCVLRFSRVLSAQASRIDRSSPDEVLSLLTVLYTTDDAPAGTIELVFSAGAAIRLQVECIEVALTDLGGAWEASSRPAHES